MLPTCPLCLDNCVLIFHSKQFEQKMRAVHVLVFGCVHSLNNDRVLIFYSGQIEHQMWVFRVAVLEWGDLCLVQSRNEYVLTIYFFLRVGP
jgi:hypothetical protein